MITTTITITPKKGETIPLVFGIRQRLFYPTIGRYLSSLRWENGETIFPSRDEKPSLPKAFDVVLMRNDVDPRTFTGESRDEHAGYTPYTRTGGKGDEPNPGSFKLRGRYLGEITVKIDFPNHSRPLISYKVNGWDTPSAGECAFLHCQLDTQLIAAIKDNAGELYQKAVRKLTGDLYQKIQEARAELNELENQANEAIKHLVAVAP